MSYVGIAGQAQNGKDTLADYLAVKMNERIMARPMLADAMVTWERSAFARSVKQVFCDTFGKDLEYVEKWKVNPEVPPDLDMTVRRALQLIGDGFRQIKGSIWIDIMFRESRNKIVSDARYVNELRAIKEHGGYNILVVHPDRVNDDSNGSEAQMRPFAMYALWRAGLLPGIISIDAPPAGWELVDYVIINDGTVDDLYRQADSLVPRIEDYFARKEAA